MAVKKLKCRFCGERKDRESGVKVPLGFFCSFEHAIEHGKAKAKGGRERSKAKADKERLKARKERVKPKSKWLAELQALVNKYVRLRDISDGCISCDKPASWGGQWHAGHYFTRGHSSSLRFNLLNIHKQCSVCNNQLSGNIGEYTPKLIGKIGASKLESLKDKKSDIASYDVDYIKRAINVTKKGIKRLERRL